VNDLILPGSDQATRKCQVVEAVPNTNDFATARMIGRDIPLPIIINLAASILDNPE